MQRRPWSGVLGQLIAVAVAVAFITGCADTKDPKSVNGTDAPSSAKPNSSEAPAAGTRSDGSTYARERAKSAVLSKDSELPDNWRPVPLDGRLSGPPGRPEYCGVVAEPDRVRQSAVTLYEEKPSQSRILQYTFVSTEKAATDTMDELMDASGDCTETGYTIENVRGFDPVGDGSIALDYRNEDGAQSRAVTFRTSNTIVVLVGYGQLAMPKEALQSFAVTIDRLLADR